MARVLAKKGLSLTEVIVSITLISLILIFVLNLYPSSMMAVARSDQLLRADTLARSTLEEYAARPFTELYLGDHALPDQKWGGTTYSLAVRLEDPAPPAVAEFARTVTVTVQWTSRTGKQEVVHQRVLAHVKR